MTSNNKEETSSEERGDSTSEDSMWGADISEDESGVRSNGYEESDPWEDHDRDSEEAVDREQVVREVLARDDVYRDPFSGIDTTEPKEIIDVIDGMNGRAALTIQKVHRDKKKLETKVRHLDEKRAKAVDKFQKAKEKFANDRVRLQKRANKELVRELLAVRDNLETAHSKSGNEHSPVPQILDQFDRVLEENDIHVIQPEPGGEIDPEKHEVVARVKSKLPEGQVVKCTQSGYAHEDTIIEPARIVVADAEPPEPSSDEDAPSTEISDSEGQEEMPKDQDENQSTDAEDTQNTAEPPQDSQSPTTTDPSTPQDSTATETADSAPDRDAPRAAVAESEEKEEAIKEVDESQATPNETPHTEPEESQQTNSADAGGQSPTEPHEAVDGDESAEDDTVDETLSQNEEELVWEDGNSDQQEDTEASEDTTEEDPSQSTEGANQQIQQNSQKDTESGFEDNDPDTTTEQTRDQPQPVEEPDSQPDSSVIKDNRDTPPSQVGEIAYLRTTFTEPAEPQQNDSSPNNGDAEERSPVVDYDAGFADIEGSGTTESEAKAADSQSPSPIDYLDPAEETEAANEFPEVDVDDSPERSSEADGNDFEDQIADDTEQSTDGIKTLQERIDVDLESGPLADIDPTDTGERTDEESKDEEQNEEKGAPAETPSESEFDDGEPANSYEIPDHVSSKINLDELPQSKKVEPTDSNVDADDPDSDKETTPTEYRPLESEPEGETDSGTSDNDEESEPTDDESNNGRLGGVLSRFR